VIVLDVLSGVLLAAGAVLLLSGAVGLLRFPDFYTRIHAAGITDSAGAGLILLGLLAQGAGWATGVRLLIILVFLAVTSPTATHLLAHAARRDGVPVWQPGEPRR
jgi:multicomponent Na+:H+ antiporter subunit G